MDWQISLKSRGNNLPTIFEEGVLVEACVCRGNELSSKINAYFFYNWFFFIKFILDLAYQFFHYILERNHTGSAAKFIKHDGNLDAFLL